MPLPQNLKKFGRNEALKGERLVRLKKYNPRRGLKLGEYGAKWKGKSYNFTQTSGWACVPLAFANYLANLPSSQGVLPGGEGDEDAPRAFWVASTIAEAERIDERERKEEEKRRSPRDAAGQGDLHVSDLRARRRFDEDDDEEEEDEPPKDEEDDDEETRAINEQIAELQQRRALLKERKDAETKRSVRAPKEDERETESDEEHEEEPEQDEDANPDINDGKPADVDFGNDPDLAKRAPTKRAPAKRAAKKAAPKGKKQGNK